MNYLRISVFISVLSSLISCSQNYKPDEVELKNKLTKAIEGFHGDVGLYFYHPGYQIEIGINEDEKFPTASMIKIPIMIGIFDKIEKGDLSLDSTVYYFKDSINYRWKGDDAISRFKEGEDITIRKLLAHMLTFSDNHASLWLQQIAGTGTAINLWMENAGYEYTRVNSRTKGRRMDYEQYGWGQTTPKEIADLLIEIRLGSLISSSASEEMYRYLTRSYWDGMALSAIPPIIQVASKQGAVDASRSEVLLVNALHGDYVLSVITKNQEDTGWEDSNEGFVLIRTVSRLIWEFCEPDFNNRAFLY